MLVAHLVSGDLLQVCSQFVFLLNEKKPKVKVHYQGHQEDSELFLATLLEIQCVRYE